MTVLNVAGLLREAPGAVREVRLRDRYLSLGPDVELAGPLNGMLRFQRTNRGILVRGEIEAPVRRTCARCLEAFVEPVSIRISEEFLPSIDPETGAAVEHETGDPSTQFIDDHHEIDLTSVIREEFALAEPMHGCVGRIVQASAPSAARGWTGTTWRTPPTRSIRGWQGWRASWTAITEGKPRSSPSGGRPGILRRPTESSTRSHAWASPSEKYRRRARVSGAHTWRSARRHSSNAAIATS